MKAERCNDLPQSTRSHVRKIMSTQRSILDYRRHAGTLFYAYTTEQMVAIVKTWAEQL